MVYLRDRAPIDSLAQEPDESSDTYRQRIESMLLSRYVPARVRLAHQHSYTIEHVERWTTALAHNLGDDLDIRLEDIWRIGGKKRVQILHTLTAWLLMFSGILLTRAIAKLWWEPASGLLTRENSW